ncbi:type III secretion system cytoplasmic ring protein SctQ [Coralloluteibacterium stylophorae]|uniref:Type III secretion system cytoplasmic ring protein SctQ n=1 Tax=Coralloluteibacterium stylophorae TaxID=1776034 RepID=A0AAP2CHB9_9GAMM|nr:type III secretion system cytoplasmic ring protein SctQ [Coralloluteibacterium stylophorae]MBS7458767.1 type III secretion system cytoplasmic ring protein SctQ [Coralloluteibacterium stylophorae]
MHASGRSDADVLTLAAAVDRLPRLAPAQAAALRALFSAPRRHAARDADGAGTLQFGPPLGLSAPWETVELQAGTTTLLLRVLRDGHADEVAGRSWSDFRDRDRLLAWSLAHAGLVELLSGALGAELLPVAIGAAEAFDGAGTWLGFVAGSGPARESSGLVRVPDPWVERLAVDAAALPIETARWRALPAPVRLQLRGPALAPADWSRLRPGDVVVLGDRAAAVREARAVPACGGPEWAVALLDSGWRALRHIDDTRRERTMDDSTAPGAGSTAAGGQDAAPAVPVQLGFDLGQVELTLAEVAGLQPGYVFDLPVHLENARVAIRANGRRVAEGELVVVGETLGVRLLHWTGPAHGLR